jgi:hypothetical protein
MQTFGERSCLALNIEGIDMRGTLGFPVEKYAERILPSSVVAMGTSRSRPA